MKIQNIKIVEVPKRSKKISGIGRADYRKNTIYIRRGLSKKERDKTLKHEMAHFALRTLKINKFPLRVVNELKKTNRYKSYIPEKYPKRKIPEEIFVDTYSALKSGEINKRRFEKSFKKKLPHSFKYFNSLFRKVDKLSK